MDRRAPFGRLRDLRPACVVHRYPAELLRAHRDRGFAAHDAVGIVEADRLRVLIPVGVVTGLALAQAKLKSMSVGGNAAVGVSAMTKLCDAPWARPTGVLPGHR